jgi:signal transduction histidine kinase/tetratricopeptide (TPR) repeat protein
MRYLKIGAIVLIFSMIFSPSTAQQLQIDSLKSLVGLRNDSSQVFIFNELSWYYKNIDVDSSELYARKAFALANDINDQALLAKSFNSLGNAKQAAGKYDSALYFLNESIRISISLGDSLKTGATLNNIGINYDERGDYVLSLQAYFKALRIADVTDDSKLKAYILSNIGVVYKKQKQYDRVLEYYQAALELYKKIDSPFGATVTAGNIGSVLLQTGDYKKSIEYSLLAKKGYEELGYSRYIPYTLGNMAIAYDSLHERKKAEQYYVDAYKQHSGFANKYEMAYVCKNLAFFYLHNDQSVNALTYAGKAIELAKNVGAKEMLRDSYYAMALVNNKLKLHEQAYLFQHKYISLNDSLMEQSRIKTIFELQTKYETEKKEQQIALQNAQLSENEIQLQRTYLIIAALGIIVTLILVILALMRSRLKRKQQLIENEKQLAVREAFIDATLQSQEAERKRVAQDLHDGMGQLITELHFLIGNITPSSTLEQRVNIVETGERLLNDMHKEVRSVAFNLMPQTLIQSGLVPALREMALRIEARQPLKIEVTGFDMDTRLTEVQEISLYRMVQEWVNNIIKYSEATKVDVNLVRNEDELSITIEDDGSGFDASKLEQSKGHGWKNILSRAGLIKANVELDTVFGRRGTTLLVNVPMHVPEKSEVENTR